MGRASMLKARTNMMLMRMLLRMIVVVVVVRMIGKDEDALNQELQQVYA